MTAPERLMRVQVACGTRKERAAIELALKHPDVRAFCAIVGYLEPLPSDRAKERVLRFVSESMSEKGESDPMTSPERLTDEQGRRYEVKGKFGDCPSSARMDDLIVRLKPAGVEDALLVAIDALMAAQRDSVLHHVIERDGFIKEDECYLKDMREHMDKVKAALAADRERVARLAQQSMKRRAAEHGAMTVAPWSKIEKEAT